MPHDSDIGLADFLVAVDTLAPGSRDHETRRQIAEILGLHWAPSRRKRDRRRPPEEAPATPSGDRRRPTPGEEAKRATQTPGKEESIGFTVDIETSDSARPASSSEWLSGLTPIAAPSDTQLEPAASPPLFRPLWERGILHAALGTTAPEGDIDVDQLVERVSRGRPIGEVPRRKRRTLRRGAQVLIDRSRSMAPYADDRRQMLDALGKLLPADRLECLNFFECPARGIRMPGQLKPREYEPPAQPRVVLLLTDLGISPPQSESRQASLEEWLEFGQTVEAAGSAVVAITPVPIERVPRELQVAMAVLPWDRPTTISHVMRERQDAPWP